MQCGHETIRGFMVNDSRPQQRTRVMTDEHNTRVSLLSGHCGDNFETLILSATAATAGTLTGWEIVFKTYLRNHRVRVQQDNNNIYIICSFYSFFIIRTWTGARIRRPRYTPNRLPSRPKAFYRTVPQIFKTARLFLDSEWSERRIF